MPTLLYLHGFRSSPQSAKARATALRVAVLNAQRAQQGQEAVRWLCPQLPPSPREAMQLCAELLGDTEGEDLALIGSSLGGFYATHLAHTLGSRAVLLNPAVDPARDLAAHIGEQTAWHDPAERFLFRPEYVDELRALAPGPLQAPERFLAVIAQGDELLDWREMAARYAGAALRLIEGSDHALSDFEHHIDAVLSFLDLL